MGGQGSLTAFGMFQKVGNRLPTRRVPLKMQALSPARQKFITMWGEMASRCATTRTAGRVHALLLTSERPLCADEIRDCLGISRSNISTALRELEGWKLLRMVHQMGDRRDFFEPVRHVGEAFHNLVGEQERRLLSPFRQDLEQHLQHAGHPTDGDPRTAQCIRDLMQFLEVLAQWLAELHATHPHELHKLVVSHPHSDGDGSPREHRKSA